MFVKREVRKMEFDRIGAAIEGVLVEFRKQSYQDGDGVLLLFRAKTGEIVKLSQSADLRDKVYASDIGATFRLQWTGSKDVGQKDHMKLFTVEVDESTKQRERAAAAGAGAGDGAEIPEYLR